MITYFYFSVGDFLANLYISFIYQYYKILIVEAWVESSLMSCFYIGEGMDHAKYIQN